MRTLPASLVVRLLAWNGDLSDDVFAERSASFIGFALLAGRVARPHRRLRSGTPDRGSPRLDDARRPLFHRLDRPTHDRQRVGEALAAVGAAACREGRRSGGAAAVLGRVLARRTVLCRPDRRLPDRGRHLRPAARLRPAPAACSRGSPSHQSASSSVSPPTARRRCSTTSATSGRPCGARPPRSSVWSSPLSSSCSAAASSGSASRSPPATASRCSCSCSRSSRSDASRSSRRRPAGRSGRSRSLWPKLSASAASGVIGGQVFVLIERILTAPLGVGAVASISYARGVAYTPAILGQAIGSGVYPSLLRAHAAGALEYRTANASSRGSG